MFEGTRGGAAEGRIGGNWRQRIQRLRLCRKSRPPGLKIDREKRYAGTGAKTIRSNGRFCDLKRNLFSPRPMARRTFSTEPVYCHNPRRVKLFPLTSPLPKLSEWHECTSPCGSHIFSLPR